MKWLKDDLIHFLQDLEDQNPDWLLNLDFPEKESEIEKFYHEMVEYDQMEDWEIEGWEFECDYKFWSTPSPKYDHHYGEEERAYYELLESWMYYGWKESEDQD